MAWSASRAAAASVGLPFDSCATRKRLPFVRAWAPTAGSWKATTSNASGGRSSADGSPILVAKRLLMALARGQYVVPAGNRDYRKGLPRFSTHRNGHSAQLNGRPRAAAHAPVHRPHQTLATQVQLLGEARIGCFDVRRAAGHASDT